MSHNQPSFVHLRSHTEYSVIDGTIRIKELVKAAQQDQQVALAVSDLMNMFGFVKFYKAARGAGLKAIAACDIWLENPHDAQHLKINAKPTPSRCLLLAMNDQGYLQLCELISKAWTENIQGDRAVVKPEWLEGLDHLILLSGAMQGDIGQALNRGNYELAKQLAQNWAQRFPKRFFIELQRAGFEGEESYIQSALQIATQLQLPVVATHPIQYLHSNDYEAHEARICIAEGETLGNPNRQKRFTTQQYFLSVEQMQERFKDIPSALQNSVEIAKRCNVKLTLGKPQLPLFPTPEGVTLDQHLVDLAKAGLEKRMQLLYPDEQERQAKYPSYTQRLERECKVIIDMGFPGYFLIVQDFINWGKKNGVPVGPGRGSGAGSLVAYSLGITDLDPLAYDLLFERFLNPERVSMPDFDIDFCQDNREKVIDYVKQKYGRDAVSQIATFGTLGAKAVVRDVGRVLQMPYSLCDGLSKLIPFNPANPWSLSDTLDKEPEFKRRYEQEEEVRAIVDTSLPLEGLTRNVGMHAGGVLIAPSKLTDFCPLYCQPGHEGSVVSQYDKGDVEDVGLVKFDFLGLRNLTILDWAVRYVRRFNQNQKDFDLLHLPLDDKATFDLFCEGNTTAVFQVESRGMKELLKKLQPNTFEDIIAVLALYRPGPLDSGMVDDFVNRKHGRAAVDYFHPDLTSTLQSTYGVIVYQEQVMLISQIIGGYSLGSADLLRRAMGKKKPEEMAKQRVIFESGAVKKGYDPEMARNLFDLMEKFAGYGFNKSHSAAYALISYQTAWLKNYYPAEFMAATMSSDMDDTDKMQIFWRDCLDNGLTMLPVDINSSAYRFEPVPDEHTKKGEATRTMRYGMGAVKGAGEKAIENIIKSREAGGPFTDLYDFCRRIIDRSKRVTDKQAQAAGKLEEGNENTEVNKRTIEALIRAGAFDSIDSNRAALLETLPQALKAAMQSESNADQDSLFGDTSGEIIQTAMSQVKPWSLYDSLLEEKKAIGFYFSHHLFDVWRHEVRRFIPSTLASLKENKQSQWLAGIVLGVRNFALKNKQNDERLYFIMLDDGSAQLEITCDQELYERCKHLIAIDNLLVLKGRVSRHGYTGVLRINAEQIYDLQSARESQAKHLSLVLNQPCQSQQLRKLLNPFRAEPENHKPGVPVRITYQAQDKWQCDIELGADWRVRLDPTLLQNLQDLPQLTQCDVIYS
ncbi:DNA polymerase III subunit alpha [Brackiella oedipodis]|uniref:DNA polymerase III subunit alpha n=1 Tax=Brackiella oedipodis TaxID=124225 RepID=UPI00068896EA|nr:DNA polymerase III subunit alpha [Brackiella oedipodis]